MNLSSAAPNQSCCAIDSSFGKLSISGHETGTIGRMSGSDNMIQSDAGGRSPMRVVFLLGFVLGAIALLGIWLGWNYVGAMQWFAELQFRLMRRWHPAISVLLVAALFALVWRLIVFGRRRKKSESDADTLGWKIRYHRVLTVLFIGATVLSVALAALSFFQLISLPRTDGDRQALSPQSGSILKEGPVAMSGWRTIGPMARYEEGLLGIGPDLWLVPIAGNSSPVGPVYTLFAQVSDRHHPLVPNAFSGVLRRSALPAEIVMLYRQNGMRVEDTAGVVFLDSTSMRRGTLFFVFEALVGALLCSIFAALARRRAKRLADLAS